eukprot:CAMPEP_0198146568 /NCGR_PEP_ID=MMETSP1443-20131203/29975_1 /TAXON_ID=186043 /ORGANISM="Entomoneis sp., Strain CCMP2396" /LENGTH=58 /DNA_ID=CAMNT_0043810573 /DNA_START=13 /DNA_END=186 /DNA_ORIENTATION=+
MIPANRLVSISNGAYITALRLVRALFKRTMPTKKLEIGHHEPLILPCAEAAKFMKKGM